MTFVKVVGYTFLNIRYASLILPCGIVAYLLQFYALAVVAGILLVAAFAAEVALSIANGIETHQSVELAKRLQAEEQDLMAKYLTDIEEWTNQNGSEGEAGEAGSEGGKRQGGPGEGEAGVSG